MSLCKLKPDSRLIYAFYADEAGPPGPCQDGHKFRINRFVKAAKSCAEFYSRSACIEAPNPLLDTTLPFPENLPHHKQAQLEKKFSKPRQYHIYVSPGLIDAHLNQGEAPKQPRAKVSLFFGVGPEIALFGLRAFFEKTAAGALVTAPGIEADWEGYGKAWGIGIDAGIIDKLFFEAGLIGQPWDLHVLAGYSTGYRSLNGTICNAEPLGLELDTVKRMTIFDCLYRHDDHAANNKNPAYSKRFTQRAVDRLVKASPDAEIAVFRVTVAGTPRGPYDEGLLAQIPGSNLTLVNFLEEERFARIRALCLCRFIQNAVVSGMVQESDLPATVIEFIKLLPQRGRFTTRPGGAGVPLFKWLERPDVKLRIAEIYQHHHGQRTIINHLIHLTVKHSLLGGWESTDYHDMMHRYFVQEFGREYLV